MFWAPVTWPTSRHRATTEKLVPSQLQWSLDVRDAQTFSWLHLCFFWPPNMLLLSCLCGPLLCLRQDPQITRDVWVFFIYLFIQPPVPYHCSASRTVRPVTANWIRIRWQLSEIMKPLFLTFSLQDGPALPHFGPHQRAVSALNLGLKELLIMLRAWASTFTSSALRERRLYGAKICGFSQTMTEK